ncbi:MAG: helix-turn-helix transcriptional regulator [Clostridia bacterium]|nr:helix-turn-helix transcriptional regulator [Clostridia bacterium]
MGNINEFVSRALNCSHHTTINPNPNSFNMHAHDVLELYIFKNGDAQYYVEGNVYPLQKNDIMIMRQGETHKLQIKRNCTYERMTLQFSPNVIEESFSSEILAPFYNRELGRMNLYRRADFETDYYIACIDKIQKCIDEKKDNYVLLAPIIALLVEINEAYKKKGQKEEKVSGHIAIDIADYINRNLGKDLSLCEIADKFFISVSSANRIFKKQVGSTIWEYVVIKRLMKAKDMIESGQTASYAAQVCGFADYSAFYRAYLKQFGISPKGK